MKKIIIILGLILCGTASAKNDGVLGVTVSKGISVLAINAESKSSYINIGYENIGIFYLSKSENISAGYNYMMTGSSCTDFNNLYVSSIQKFRKNRLFYTFGADLFGPVVGSSKCENTKSNYFVFPFAGIGVIATKGKILSMFELSARFLTLELGFKVGF